MGGCLWPIDIQKWIDCCREGGADVTFNQLVKALHEKGGQYNGTII